MIVNAKFIRVMLIALTAFVMLSLFNASVFAAPDASTFDVQIELHQDSSKQYNNMNVMRVDILVKGNEVTGITNVVLHYDDAQVVPINKDAVAFTLENMAEGNGAAENFYEYDYVDYVGKFYMDATKTIVSLQPEYPSSTLINITSNTRIASYYFGVKTSWETLTPESVRLATVDEAVSVSQDSVVQASNSGTSLYWGHKDGGANNTLLATPTITPVGFTFAIPAYDDNANNVLIPVAAKSYNTTITVYAGTLTGGVETIEYARAPTNALPTSGWQDSEVFYNVPVGDHYFFARVKARDGVHSGGTAKVTDSATTIYAAPTLTYSNIPTSPSVGDSFSIQPTVTGGAPAADPAFAITSDEATKTKLSNLGLSLNETTGYITGMATAKNDTAFNVEVTYTDNDTPARPAVQTVTIPVISGATTPITFKYRDDDGTTELGSLPSLVYGDIFYVEAEPRDGDSGTPTYGWSASDGAILEFANDDMAPIEANVKKVTVIKPTTTPITISCTFSSASHNGTGNITGLTFGQKLLGLTVTAADRYYVENSTEATVNTAVITGQVTGDGADAISLRATYGTGTFDNQFAGLDKTVTFQSSAFTLDGSKKDYYKLPTSVTANADINSAAQTLTTTHDSAEEAYTILKDGGSVNLATLVEGDYNPILSGTVETNPANGTVTVNAATGVLTTAGGEAGDTFVVNVTSPGYDKNPIGVFEYSSSNAIQVYFKMVDKATNTTDMTVSMPAVTFGDTLAPTATSPTVPAGETLSDASFTYLNAADRTAVGGSGIPVNAGDYIVVAKRETATTIYTAEANFTIAPKNISSATINLTDHGFIYDGTEKTQQITSVVVGGNALALIADYTINTGTDKGTDADTYTLTISGTGNYTGTKTANFTIAQATISITGATGVTKIFDGTNKVTKGVISFSTPAAGYTILASDYTVSGTYDTIDVGSTKDATVTVTLTGATAKKNYKLQSSSYNVSRTAEISELTIVDKAITIPILWNNTDEQTINFESYIPSNAGPSSIFLDPTNPNGIVVDDSTHSILNPDPAETVIDIAAKTIKFSLLKGLDKITDKGDTVTFTATIDSLNYANFDIVVTYEITDYIAPPVVPGTSTTTPSTSVSTSNMSYPAAEVSGGAIITIARGSSPTFTFHEMTAENLAGLWIDGMAVDMNAVADISYGSVIVKLKSSFTNTLANGEHTIHVVGKDGSFGFAKFYVGGHTNPQTGM